MSECIAGQTYTFRISVFDEADPTIAKNNPTINAADFLLSINDGADTALTNTPTVVSSSRVIKVIFSAAETTAAGANGSIVLKVADASASDGWLGGDIEIKVRAYATATSNDVATLPTILTEIEALNVIPAASAGSGAVAGALSIIKAATFEGTITGVVAPSGWTKAYLTVKLEGQLTSADATSVMQLMVTNPGNGGTDGLKIINGASATLSGGSIAIVAVDNEVDIVLTDDTTSLLTTGNYVYDIKFFYSTSKSGHIYTGTLSVSATATQTYNTA